MEHGTLTGQKGLLFIKRDYNPSKNSATTRQKGLQTVKRDYDSPKGTKTHEKGLQPIKRDFNPLKGTKTLGTTPCNSNDDNDDAVEREGG